MKARIVSPSAEAEHGSITMNNFSFFFQTCMKKQTGGDDSNHVLHRILDFKEQIIYHVRNNINVAWWSPNLNFIIKLLNTKAKSVLFLPYSIP